MAASLAFGALLSFASVDALATGRLARRQQSCDRNAPTNLGPGVEHVETSTEGGYLWPYQIFKSSDVRPPVMEVNVTEGETLAPGLVTLTISATTKGNASNVPVTNWQGPQIFNDKGQLVWVGPKVDSLNLRQQTLDGADVLTYWSGGTTEGLNVGHGYGNITFLDNTYQTRTVLCPHYPDQQTADGIEKECGADMHEAQMTARGTMLVVAYNATPADLSPLGGPVDGWVWDSQIYEHDPTTGEELFRWSSIEHVPVKDSRAPLGSNGNRTVPFDYFHINSVVDLGEYYLANSRHTWGIYLIDKAGEVVWTLDGETGGDFGPLPDGVGFRWQHFARPHSVSNDSFVLSLYNNNNRQPNGTRPTDLLMYEIPLIPEKETTTSQALLRSQIQTVEPLYSSSQGSYEAELSNGNKLAAYGPLPMIKEFDPYGHEIWSGRIGPDNLAQLYRGFKTDWHATPYYKPDLAVEEGKAYVSWNGATDVTEWNVYVGESGGKLELAGTVGFKGFETQFDLPCWATSVQVGAVDGENEVRRSEVVSVA